MPKVVIATPMLFIGGAIPSLRLLPRFEQGKLPTKERRARN